MGDERSRASMIAGIFIVFATVLYFIAFVSPYWLASQSRANSPFQRIGLWEACLKDYVDPKDYVSKLYNGCWWVFWPEYREIRWWLNPPIIVAVQVLAAINFVIIFLAMFIVAGMMCNCCSEGNVMLGFITTFTSFLFSVMEAILFGMASIDRTWMPKSDYNILSWGYWLHVLGGFFTFIAAVALFCNWYTDRYEDYEQNQKSSRKYQD